MPAGKITLTTADNEEFVVDKDVAERSVLIKNMLEGQWLCSSLMRICDIHAETLAFCLTLTFGC
jgi:hypothetical protein